MFAFLKNKKVRLWGGLLIVVILVVVYFMRSGKKAPTYEYMAAKRGELVQEVNVTGNIKPAQAVDLQFESSGRLASLNYKVGNKVNAGAIIASLDNQDLQASVTSARADYDKTVRNFNSLSDPSIFSALRVELQNSEANIEQVAKKGEGDLASKYSLAVSTIREAMTEADTSSVVLEYLRKTYLQTNYTWNTEIQNDQADATLRIQQVRALLPAIDQSNATITAGMYGQIDAALPQILGACQSLRAAFNYLQEQVQGSLSLIFSSTDRASLNTEASAISTDLSSVASAIQGISDQKILNNKNNSDAQAKLATAKASFPTSDDILQKQAALFSAQSQLRKSTIIAPFAGTIGKVDVEVGQTVNSSTLIVSLVSSAKYQIEANITEVDIGKIAVGNPATLTLDAYGPQVVLNAKVLTIDTTATVVEGVTTYKTVFDFDGPINQDIRPNMTANIDVQTAKKENVISIPQRAVITKNGQKIVRIYHGDKTPIEERTVELGIPGKDGYVEVINGISEGDQVVTFVNE